MTVDLPGDPKSYELAYDQARAGIDHQVGAVDEVRTRAGLLLGAASIAASFLGGIALEDGVIAVPGVLAVGAFVLASVYALIILAPYRDWRFILSAEILIDGWVEGDPPAGPPEMHRQLALLMLANQAHNQTELDRRWEKYQWGLRALVGMILLWLVELIGLLPPLAL